MSIRQGTVGILMGIDDLEEIARLMDKTEFEEFCRIWNEVYK